MGTRTGAHDGATAEERIAEAFDAYFAQSGIRIGADEVVVGTRREVRRQGWRILMRVVPDEGGSPSLEFYATHRMTNDRHVRIWADGHLEHPTRSMSSTHTTPRSQVQRRRPARSI